MKLMRIGSRGAERPALLTDDGTTLDLSGLTADVDGTFLASGGIDRVRRAVAEGDAAAPGGDTVSESAPRSPGPARWCVSG